MKKVAIVGSHGLYADYGGFEQLVRNLVDERTANIHYVIFNPRNNPVKSVTVSNITLKKSLFKASGFEGLFFDFFSILRCFYKVDTVLMLGVQGMPIIPLLLFFRKTKVVCNSGGIEWERDKFGFFAKVFLRKCFSMSLKYADEVILDNEHFKVFVPKNTNHKAKIRVLPYGGGIDNTLKVSLDLLGKYSFLNNRYFLSISRSIPDNMVKELCESFVDSGAVLVLISNLSNSQYGRKILNKYKAEKNIYLIDGLYDKPLLDLIRRKCLAYIHTHTSCGTAPSLVEMAVSKRPIISIDNPQNRVTLRNEACYFSTFNELKVRIQGFKEGSSCIVSDDVILRYSWPKIVSKYQKIL